MVITQVSGAVLRPQAPLHTPAAADSSGRLPDEVEIGPGIFASSGWRRDFPAELVAVPDGLRGETCHGSGSRRIDLTPQLLRAILHRDERVLTLREEKGRPIAIPRPNGKRERLRTRARLRGLVGRTLTDTCPECGEVTYLTIVAG